ncbi:hypothetical protein GCM10022252_75410 [Streptosporangium oxazolinicum]|uniref:Uncharacterized protein n=1 Tax=Streptosporangium oxazolinicum TaxID=909287 RepID=A0ABP8BKK8_9ACTN
MHDYVAGANIPVTHNQARIISTVRRSLLVEERTWVIAHEAWCQWCNMGWARAVGLPCPGSHADHLIGGTPGERLQRVQIPGTYRKARIGGMSG